MAEVSLEMALKHFRARYAEASDENVILASRIEELEAEVARLQPNNTPQPPDKT